MPDEGEHFDIIWNQLSLPTHSAQLKWLTHFHADFQFIKNEYFAKLLALFPNLQVLRLKAADPRLQDRLTQEMFLDVVCTYSSPSSQLRFLAIDWSANEDDDLDEKHQAAKDRLTENFPLLEELWLCDWRKSAFLWRRTADRVTIYPTRTKLEILDALLAHQKPSYSGSSLESMADIYLRSCQEKFSMTRYRVID